MISSDRPSQRLILEAGRADRQYWRDLWRYRELFFILAWRDVAVRYKQTVIGLAWAFVRPFITMVVFTIVFGKLAKLPTEGAAPYAVLVFAGLLPWTLASSILSDASGSVLTNSQLVSKVYFPRIIIPFATVMVGLVDFFHVWSALLLGLGFAAATKRPRWFATSFGMLLYFLVIAAVTIGVPGLGDGGSGGPR